MIVSVRKRFECTEGIGLKVRVRKMFECKKRIEVTEQGKG